MKASRRNFLKWSGISSAVFAGLSSSPALAHLAEIDDSYRYYCDELIEITEPGKLIGPDGTARCSWSRRPYLDLNFEDADFMFSRAGQRYRFKKWDMYHFATPDLYVGLLVAWIGYGAFCSAHVYDRETKTNYEDLHLRLPWPEFPMMRNSDQGITEYQSRKVTAVFEVQGERRKLRMDFPGFQGSGLQVEVDLHHPQEHESICGTFLTHPRRMNYGHKINCMPVSGEVIFKGRKYLARPDDSFGALDFGRGYYPPKLFWYWATASGLDPAGKLVGFNLGYGNTRANTQENALFYDGKLHKVGQVNCACDPFDLRNPWRVWTDDGKVDLSLIPENVRHGNLKIGPFYSISRPALGYYHGNLTLDSGRVIRLQDLFGLFEWVDQKW